MQLRKVVIWLQAISFSEAQYSNGKGWEVTCKLISRAFPESQCTSTECARDRDLYELVSCCKFVNEILFCNIYKTLYLTLGHYALGVILCLCLFLSYQKLNCFCKAKEA
jgi:hypothetical protein